MSVQKQNQNNFNNVDDENALAMKYGVMSIPTLIVFQDGKEKTRIVGARPKAAILAELV